MTNNLLASILNYFFLFSSYIPQEEIDEIYANLADDETALARRVNKKIRMFGFAPNSADLNKFIETHAEVLYVRTISKGLKERLAALYLDDNPRRWVRGASLFVSLSSVHIINIYFSLRQCFIHVSV